MSVDIPKITIAFGSMAPPQGDIIELRVHLGCTKEVSSFECLLQNWDSKYVPSGQNSVEVGVDGNISIGRGTNVPQIITCRVESVKYESTPHENYLRVSGRCWGERLFRRVVTKVYENKKGEEIVKDLVDYYVGLSHLRDSVELVENTDTTYTRLEYEDTPVIDVLRYVSETADKAGVIGYDFRVAPDGKFEFFPRNSKTSSISLDERIESSEFRKDIHAVRNKIIVYGAADKSLPYDKDSWTESLIHADGVWTAPSGTLSLDVTNKIKGVASIKSYNIQAYYASAMLTLNPDKEVDANLYPVLSFWLRREASFNGNIDVILSDGADKIASHLINVGPDKWMQQQIKVGAGNADLWNVEEGFDWSTISKVRFDSWFSGVGEGSFWVDGLFFGGRKYSATEQDATSQSAYGLRELVEVDEELYSDTECQYRAKALLACLKDPAEFLTLRSSVVEYGNNPILPGDRMHVRLPNEDVDSDFRVLSVEYVVDGKSQTLELDLELGRERSLLADFIYALRSKTDHLSRHKIARAV